MLKERLRNVFIESLGLPADMDVSELKYQEIGEWDSLSHLQLVAAIESEFGIMLETDDVIDMSSFAKALAIVAKYDVVATA